ncbi:MAG: bestrophin family protein [Flavobacteriales bacterium]
MRLIIINSIVALLYYYNTISFKITWLPVSVIGTAVAFYLGFKNNNSYDRLWEARKIWGGIVNESRTWGMMIDDFRHIKLSEILRSFYRLQGKNERIKKFPLPRQYSAMSEYFVWIFILLLPFSMVPELMEAGNWGIWLSIPITALVGWVYQIMEIIGDYSENPFEGLMNDIPMMSLCRTIEIDLREILDEKDLPLSIEPVNGILN